MLKNCNIRKCNFKVFIEMHFGRYTHRFFYKTLVTDFMAVSLVKFYH